MNILDYFKNMQSKKNTTLYVYGVFKEVLYDNKMSAFDYIMTAPFNTKQYIFPCFFLSEDDARALRNAYTKIKSDGERYGVFQETYNNIFGNGKSLFKHKNQKLYSSLDEFVTDVKNEYESNSKDNNLNKETKFSNKEEKIEKSEDKSFDKELS